MSTKSRTANCPLCGKDSPNAQPHSGCVLMEKAKSEMPYVGRTDVSVNTDGY